MQTAIVEIVTVLGSTTVPFTVGRLQATLTVVVAAVEEEYKLGVDFLKAHKCVFDFDAGLLHLGTDSFPILAVTVTVLCNSGLPINDTSPYLYLHVFPIKLAARVLPLYESASAHLKCFASYIKGSSNLYSTGEADRYKADIGSNISNRNKTSFPRSTTPSTYFPCTDSHGEENATKGCD